MDNANSREYLEKIRIQVIENLKRTTFAPSVQMQDVPRDSLAMNDEDEAAMDDLDEDEKEIDLKDKEEDYGDSEGRGRGLRPRLPRAEAEAEALFGG